MPSDRQLRSIADAAAEKEKAAGTLHPKARVRKWHVVRVNCDCAAYTHTMLRPPGRSGSFTQMRCRDCRKPLGDMEVEYRGFAYAARPADAVGAVEQARKARGAKPAAIQILSR